MCELHLTPSIMVETVINDLIPYHYNKSITIYT